jgi:hypothetical protein
LGGLLILLILAWLGLGWYLHANKKDVLAKVTAALGERMRGELRIRDMEPSLFVNFPNVALNLKDITLRDSLWGTHHHSLLEAKNIYVRLNPFALITKRVEITKLTAANGTIFVYTDSTGYSNTYLLARKDTTKTNRTTLVERFALDNMHLYFVNQTKYKLFHLYFKKLDGTATQNDHVIDFAIAGGIHVHEFNFNTTRGSYLHGQDLDLDLEFSYSALNKRLQIPLQRVGIGRSTVKLGGTFFFDRTPSAFALQLQSEGIDYKTAVSWLSPNIRKSLDSLDFKKPIAINVNIKGVMQYKNIPFVNVAYETENNTLVTPVGEFADMKFHGAFNNEAVPGAGHGDDNSRISMYGLHATWNEIPFEADTLWVTNLLRPAVNTRIRSSFAIPKINDIIGGKSIAFERGLADADLRYEGGVLPNDPSPYAISGTVRISDAAFNYLPRNLSFTKVGAVLQFAGDNLYFRNITLASQHSSILMEGDALHFTRLYFADPGKVEIAWRIRSPLINLNDFLGFASARRTVATAPKRSLSGRVTRIGNQLDAVLNASTIRMDARIDKLIYKSLVSESVVARAAVLQSGINLQQVQIRLGQGSLDLNAFVNQSAANNPFTIKAKVRNMDVARLFKSFDNFGQTAIRADNITGTINVDADMQGQMTEGGTILKNSLAGNLSFDLNNGQLRNLPQLEKVSKYVFKNRHLERLDINKLDGALEVAGSKIVVRPMDIQTSALNMKLQGIYGLNGGTDLFMEIPLRNPEKEGLGSTVGRFIRRGKGLVVNLRAQDPDGKSLKIGWDPLKHGQRATDEKLSDTN